MSLEIIIPIAAIIVLLMLLSWSIQVFKLTIKTLLPIVAIFLLLQIGLGFSAREIINGTIQTFQSIWQLIDN